MRLGPSANDCVAWGVPGLVQAIGGLCPRVASSEVRAPGTAIGPLVGGAKSPHCWLLGLVNPGTGTYQLVGK